MSGLQCCSLAIVLWLAFLLFVLGTCEVSHDSDEDAERIAAHMKEQANE